MIRELELVCSECGEKFLPKEKLFYRDDYMANSIRETKLICDKCIAAWNKKWKIKSAVFAEKDCVMTVDLELKDGTKYTKLDCTAIPETEIVVVGEDIPLEAQKKLYKIFAKWDMERKANLLKDCIFKEEFMRTTVTCATYGGEKFKDVAFRVNRKGELETEVAMPDYIKAQVLENFYLYGEQAAMEEGGENKDE
ncbi:MAG: hypothetical protein KBS60_07470 [Phascolarctobacterium sp.]|nr:hypothetical protein [Candidatus Phascolarctobacterium caballi]